MAQHGVRIEKTSLGLSVHFTGPAASKANQALLQQCFTALLECAEKNGCFEKGFSAACLGTIAKHDSETGCCSKAFGFASA